MASSAPYLRVEDLGKRYGQQWATRHVSFEVEKGEIFGIIGPNGAGKTTTIKTLAGLLAPTEGRATAGGIDTLEASHKSRIGYLPEESPLYDDMTPLSYLHFFAKLYEVPRRVADQRIEETLTALQLEVRNEKKIGDLSKGMRRKVAIARALVNDPEMVILDEPASGLDPVVSAYILDLVRSLSRAGKTVIFSAHNLYHMERICDRVLILRKGSVVAQGTMKQIRSIIGGTEYVVTVSAKLPESTLSEKGYDITVRDLEAVKGIERRAHADGGHLVEVRTKELSLEEIFLKTTAADADGDAAAVALSESA